MKYFKAALFLLFALSIVCASGQGSFQNNRKAFQKIRYKQTSKKYRNACEIFEKKRTKGERKPLLSLGPGRKTKRKLAEQN